MEHSFKRILIIALVMTAHLWGVRGVQLGQFEYPMIANESTVYDIFSSKEYRGEVVLSLHFSENLPTGIYELRIPMPLSEGFVLESQERSLSCRLLAKEGSIKTIEDRSYTVFALSHEEDSLLEKEINLAFLVPPLVPLSPGKYIGNVSCELWLGETQMSTHLFAPYLEVEQQLEATFSDSREAPATKNTFQTLNFGEIIEETKKQMYFSMRGNTDFEVSIESVNRGKMKYQDFTEAIVQEHYFPYCLFIDGREVDLRDTQRLLQYQMFTNVVKPLTILMRPDIKRNFAGCYKDSLLITIANP